jgi:23S rRNA G2445 N2-methylase RlmL
LNPSGRPLPPELAELLSDPGFTPGAAHLDALFTALGEVDREPARRLERVAARGGARAGLAAAERALLAHGVARARLLAVVGRVAQDEPSARLTAVLLGALDDAHESVRRAAIVALGKLGPKGLEARLLPLWASAGPAEKRALIEALGKVGGEQSRALLAGIGEDDSALLKSAERARLIIARNADRDETATIALDAPLATPHTLWLRCRRGLAEILCDEARSLGAVELADDGGIRFSYAGDFKTLLTLRTALDFGIEIPILEDAQSGLEARVVRALGSEPALAALRAWTHGRPRFRLSFMGRGHQRASVWTIANQVAQTHPFLRNDPRGSTWEVSVAADARKLWLLPRDYDDPRFAYREQDVRAASHPTIAAALARVAGARPDDVVWDPFVGSGLELAERGLLAPFAELHGSDVEPDAIRAARHNLERAGLGNASLVTADARTHVVPGVTLILTNPPMGRRVARDGSLSELLQGFLENAARQIRSGGRLVWLSPQPAKTRQLANELGLSVERVSNVDMGGFPAELQKISAHS